MTRHSPLPDWAGTVTGWPEVPFVPVSPAGMAGPEVARLCELPIPCTSCPLESSTSTTLLFGTIMWSWAKGLLR